MKGMISADSHITEPPGTYVDYIERKFKDRAPRMVRDPKLGDMFVVEGFNRPLQIGLVAAAGKKRRGAGAVGREIQGDASRRLGS